MKGRAKVRPRNEVKPKDSVDMKFPKEYKQDSAKIVNEKGESLPSISGFVTSSVLRATKDGFFDTNSTEEVIEQDKSSSSTKDHATLYDRLKEQKDQKDKEWSDTHNAFAPPMGLDDEDFAFVQSLQARKKRDIDERSKHFADGLASFAEAQKSSKISHKLSSNNSKVKKNPTMVKSMDASIKRSVKVAAKSRTFTHAAAPKRVPKVNVTAVAGQSLLGGQYSSSDSDE